MKTTIYEYEYERIGFCVRFFWFGFHAIRLGFHVDFAAMNIEVHIPFCFVQIGMRNVLPIKKVRSNKK